MSELKISSSQLQVPDTKLPNFDAAKSHEQLVKAAKEFEAVFMDMVTKSMRNTVMDNDENGESEKVKFFQSMLDTEFSGMSTKGKNKGLGIAETIVKQFEKRDRSAALMAALSEKDAAK